MNIENLVLIGENKTHYIFSYQGEKKEISRGKNVLQTFLEIKKAFQLGIKEIVKFHKQEKNLRKKFKP